MPPLSELGRRPALLVGLSLFTIASVAGLFAPDVHTLIVARFFQALGGCSGLVLARAMIRDTSQAHEAARRLALTNLHHVLVSDQWREVWTPVRQ